MPSISRGDLIRRLRFLGFDGPISGTRHQLMRRGNRVVFLPNPHGGDIGAGLLARVLRQAGVGRDEWEASDP